MVNRVGLALGSGGSRGIAHISVIEYLDGLGIPVHSIAGSSIGSLIGVLYSLGKLDEFKAELMAMRRKDILALADMAFIKHGLVKGDKLMRHLERYIPPYLTFSKLPIPVSIVATDYQTGEEVIFTRGNVLRAIRASISIPTFFVPVSHKKTFLIDGTLSNPLPIRNTMDLGAQRVIAVNLHPAVNKKYYEGTGTKVRRRQKRFTLDLKGPFGKLFRKKEEPYPTIFEVALQTMDILEHRNTSFHLKTYPPAVCIEPRLLDINILDFSHPQAALKEGHQACLRREKELRQFVKEVS